jgi:hypothetical protein
VEPTSVTPFAVPVRERALHAIIVTLVRLLGNEDLRARPQPGPDEDIQARIKEIISTRVGLVDPEELESTIGMFLDFIRSWNLSPPPIYGHFGPSPEETPLMHPSGTEERPDWNGRSRATPSSMRNVDVSCDAAVILEFPQSAANQ